MLAPSNGPLSFIYRTLSALRRVASPQHLAVSLGLTDQAQFENLPEAEPQGGIAPRRFLGNRNGKAEPNRDVLRLRRTARRSPLTAHSSELRGAGSVGTTCVSGWAQCSTHADRVIDSSAYADGTDLIARGAFAA
jgi:hypothetical protein